MSTSIPQPVNIISDLARITKHWSPQHILTVDGTHSFKLAKVQGDFIWHSHPDTDETFYCVSGGPLNIELATYATSPDQAEKAGKDHVVELKVGDVFCVPRGTQHRPMAEAETGVLIIEKVGTVNTGDKIGSERKFHVDEGL